MAERSKAPVSGTGLFGGVGSNPTPITFFVVGASQFFEGAGAVIFLCGAKKIAETGNRTQASAATMQGTAIILSRRGSSTGRCGVVVAPRCNAGAHNLPNHRHLSKAVNASAS